MTLANLIKAYGFGRIQDLLTLYAEIEDAGYTMDDLKSMVDTKRALMEKREKISNILNSQACPNCGALLEFNTFNNNSADKTDDGVNSGFVCHECEFSLYTRKNFRGCIKHLVKFGSLEGLK